MPARVMFRADTLTCGAHPTRWRRDPSKTPVRADKTPLSTLTLSQFFSKQKNWQTIEQTQNKRLKSGLNMGHKLNHSHMKNTLSKQYLSDLHECCKSKVSSYSSTNRKGMFKWSPVQIGQIEVAHVNFVDNLVKLIGMKSNAAQKNQKRQLYYWPLARLA